MSELSDLWAELKGIELSTKKETPRLKAIQKRIHEIQKGMGSSPYDFDKRRSRNEAMSVESVVGPPDLDSPAPSSEEQVPQANFTYDQARKLISDNDFALLEDCAKDYEIKAVVIGRILEGMNPTNITNHARRGQGINWTLTKFWKDKEKNDGS